MTQRADDFKQAFRNLQLQPLISPEETRNFRVPYGEELLPALEQMILDCTDTNNQLIFAGHRGCGKSTLLAQFSRQIQSSFFTVFFSISDLIEMSEINHINILFAIALQLMAEAAKQNIDIEKDKVKSILGWFGKHTRTEVNNLSAEVTLGFDLFKTIAGKIKTDASIRDEIKTEFQKSFRDLISTINLIAIEIKLACHKEIVVIIDDIDKLDLSQVEDIFRRNIKALLQPKFIVIYTIPIATIRDGGLTKHIEDETGNSIFLMPVKKLFSQGSRREANPQPLESTMQTLREVLFKRVKPELFAEGIADQILIYSGGVLRELIRITQECCRLVRVQVLLLERQNSSVTDMQIDENILVNALENLRNGMAITLSKTDREILKTTYENQRPDDPKQQDFLDLLHNIYAIEYRNSSSWYDVHPLIIDQLRREEIIV